MARLKIEVRKSAMGTATSRSTTVAQTQAQPQMLQPPPQQTPVPGGVAAGIIDLTAEGEDSDDSDEPLGGGPPAPVVTASVAATATSVSAPIGDLVSSNQDGESDVDEDWPTQEAMVVEQAATPATNSSASATQQQPDEGEASDRLLPSIGAPAEAGDRGVNSDQDDEEEDEELPIRVVPSREISSESVLTAKLSDSDENDALEKDDKTAGQRVMAEDQVQTATSADENAMVVGNEAVDDQPNAPAKAPVATTDIEYLEDGEIFEEGAVSASPEKVKETIAQELQAARDAAAESEALRPKKHKKRGKKKSKRKLDAMMMQQAGPDFDRSVRHQPFMLRNPHDPRMVFLGPSAIFGDPAHPQAPPPLPNVNGGPPFPPPPPPMFANDQIMRVNRRGSVKMFNSQSEFQAGDIPATFLGPSGFNYVVPRAPTRIDPKQAMLGPPSSAIPKPPSSVSTESIHSQDEDEPMMNLDDLRAAALRTKKTETTSSQNSESTAVANLPASSSTIVSLGSATPQEEEPDIDELRAAILKSMKKRPKNISTMNANGAADKIPESDSAARSGESKTQKSIAKNVPTVIVSSTEELGTTELPQVSPPSSQVGTSVSGSGSGSLSGSEGASPEAESSNVTSPISAANSVPSISIGTMTPEFRPLTAASQSIVIRLSPEDYVKTTPTAVESRRHVSKTNGSNIEAAIEEMKRKIAEREKQLLSSNNRSAPVGKPAQPGPCSPGKVTKSVPVNDPTEEEDSVDQDDAGACDQSNAESSNSGPTGTSDFIQNEEANQKENSVQNAIQDALPQDDTTVVAKQVAHMVNVEVLDVSSQPAEAETIVADTIVVPITDDSTAGSAEYMSVLNSLKGFVQQLKTCEDECKKADQEVKRIDDAIAQIRQQILAAEAAAQAS